MVYRVISSAHMKKPLSISDEIFTRKDRGFFESLTINFPVNKERLQQLLFS